MGALAINIYRWTERGPVPAPTSYEPGQRGPVAVYPAEALLVLHQ